MARKKRTNIQVVDEKSSDKMIWKAATYSRLSVEDGDDIEQNSIGNQKKIGLHFLSEKKDIVLIENYCDNGFTGMNYNRPDFKRMFHDLQLGKINCIIVKDISRLGRNYVMTADLVERIFPEMGIRLICINDDYDSIDAYADAQALTLPLKMVINDYYAKDISRKIRSSINAKMDNGEFLPSSGSIPYGYIRDPENNTFAVDPETAPVVLRIFQMRAEGVSFNSICRELNQENILCPGRLRYERGMTNAAKYKNAFWIRGTVRHITQNKEYIGCRIHGKVKRERIGLDKRRRPESEWIVIYDSHPSIISKELFEKVQNVNASELSKRSGFVRRNDCENEDRNLFRGLVYCAECRSPMSAGKGCARHGAKTPSRIFYDCNNYRYSAHVNCSSHYIRYDQIYYCVKDVLDEQIKVAVDVERLVEEVENNPNSIRSALSTSDEYSSIVLKRKNIEAKIEQLLIDLTKRVIDRSEYDYMKEKYDQQHSVLLEAEKKAEEAKESLQTAISSAKAWLYAIKRFQALPELNSEIVGLLVKEILVFDDRHVKVILNYEDPYKPITQYLDSVEEDNENGKKVRHAG